MMSDVEALLTRGDHKRGCEGRTYTCTCGYDERMEAALRTLSEQLAEAREVIAALRKPSPLGLDVDGMCDDHGAFMCKLCLPSDAG